MLCGPWLKSSQKQHSLGTLQSQPQLLASCQTPDCDLLEGKSFAAVDGIDQRWMKKPQEVESIQSGAARQGVKLLGSGKADLLKSSPAPQLIPFTGNFSPTLSASLLPYGGGILPSTWKAVNMARNSTHITCVDCTAPRPASDEKMFCRVWRNLQFLSLGMIRTCLQVMQAQISNYGNVLSHIS